MTRSEQWQRDACVVGWAWSQRMRWRRWKMAFDRSCNSDNAGPSYAPVAPHSGHVSNFCGLKRSALEPTQPLHLQYDMDRMRRPIHTGHPAWMHRDPPDFMDRVLRHGHAGSLQIRASQNCFAIPACLSTALAVCLDRMFPSTGKRRCVIGLYQIWWSPLPGRSK